MPSEGNNSNIKDRQGILSQIRNPLIFFALALLVIEGIIGGVVAMSKMTAGYQFCAVCIMAFLFLVVVIAVILITIKWPGHLYEEIVRELETAKNLRKFVNSQGFQDVIRDVVEEILASRNDSDICSKNGGKGE